MFQSSTFTSASTPGSSSQTPIIIIINDDDDAPDARHCNSKHNLSSPHSSSNHSSISNDTVPVLRVHHCASPFSRHFPSPGSDYGSSSPLAHRISHTQVSSSPQGRHPALPLAPRSAAHSTNTPNNIPQSPNLQPTTELWHFDNLRTTFCATQRRLDQRHKTVAKRRAEVAALERSIEESIAREHRSALLQLGELEEEDALALRERYMVDQWVEEMGVQLDHDTTSASGCEVSW